MIPTPPPRTTQPDELARERTALSEAGPITPTVLAVAETAARLLAILDRASVLHADPARPVADTLWDYRITGQRASYHANPIATWVATHLPPKHPELSDWRIAVYGYRLVVGWREPTVEGTASLVMLMPYSVNVLLDEFNAGGHHRLVSRRRPWARSPRTTPPSTPPRTLATEPPIAKRLADTEVQEPDPSGARRARWWSRRRTRAILQRPPLPGQPLVLRPCGCKAFFGGHGYDPTDPTQRPDRLEACGTHQGTVAVPVESELHA
jgi:hypothetical protein